MAQVRREWEEPALRLLWRELPSLVPLFKLLGEMTFSGAGTWVRFQCKRKRIEVLTSFFSV